MLIRRDLLEFVSCCRSAAPVILTFVASSEAVNFEGLGCGQNPKKEMSLGSGQSSLRYRWTLDVVPAEYCRSRVYLAVNVLERDVDGFQSEVAVPFQLAGLEGVGIVDLEVPKLVEMAAEWVEDERPKKSG